ncbi:NitT/TauT family transport system substrate-binding protein [Devosia enhydra]|uniref:NitT/TauT family transport system substrate-binding protein n=1 Tax=Devosia enhydra TaxID=665118 RepID=A0A1K2HTK3_9HYPH|nr:ABC transporter substrate-binding protein [Devosia enhydra]SFZ81559.1 NitT/TauT family transport system substrate-binding protein [Devosia enhydra]
MLTTAFNRRSVLGLMGAGAASLALPMPGLRAQSLEKINYIFAFPAISTIVANQTSIPKYYGLFEKEGLEVEQNVSSGGASTAIQLVTSGDQQVASGSIDQTLVRAAAGEDLGLTLFYNQIRRNNTTLVTNQDSDVRTIADLRGKTVGVQSLGSAPEKTLRIVLRDNDIDPDTEVTFVAVGIAAQALQALRGGEVDAYVAALGTVSTMEALGEKFHYPEMPAYLRESIGPGLFTRRDMIESHRQQLVGIGRVVAKSTVFVKANPEAAVRIHWHVYPEQVPQGMGFDEALANAVDGLRRQIDLLEFQPNETVRKYGFMSDAAIDQLKRIQGAEAVDSSLYFSNALVDEINDFNVSEMEALAKNFTGV